MVKRQSTVWIDAGGRTIVQLLTTSGGAAAVQSELEAASNAAVQSRWEGDLVVAGSPAPVAATYADVADYALLQFSTGSGSLVAVKLPAPHAGIFMSDGETVDPASIATLRSAILANVVTPSGVALSAYVAGLRVRQ